MKKNIRICMALVLLLGMVVAIAPAQETSPLMDILKYKKGWDFPIPAKTAKENVTFGMVQNAPAMQAVGFKQVKTGDLLVIINNGDEGLSVQAFSQKEEVKFKPDSLMGKAMKEYFSESNQEKADKIGCKPGWNFPMEETPPVVEKWALRFVTVEDSSKLSPFGFKDLTNGDLLVILEYSDNFTVKSYKILEECTLSKEKK